MTATFSLHWKYASLQHTEKGGQSYDLMKTEFDLRKKIRFLLPNSHNASLFPSLSMKEKQLKQQSVPKHYCDRWLILSKNFINRRPDPKNSVPEAKQFHFVLFFFASPNRTQSNSGVNCWQCCSICSQRMMRYQFCYSWSALLACKINSNKQNI